MTLAWRHAHATTLGVACLSAALSACGGAKTTLFQSYVVQLNGPVPAYVNPETDPFAKTSRYRATISYFEDADGLVPYGSTLKTKPPEFKDFHSTITIQ